MNKETVLRVLLFMSLYFTLLQVQGFGAKWNSLKATWCNTFDPNVPQTEYCFRSIPLTVADAEATGWRKVSSSCKNDRGQFFGNRYIYKNELGLSPLYDRRGIIAGIQVNLPVDELFHQYNAYHYCRMPVYQLNTIEETLVYSTTTYFVEPATICLLGRSKEELLTQGTANQLYFQEGPTPAPRFLVPLPLYRDEAAKIGWTENECVPTMGHHNYYLSQYFEATHCTEIRPSFLLFNNNGELHGFGQTAVGNLSSPVYEHPDKTGIRGGLGNMSSKCMLHISEHELYSNVHFWLVDNPKEFPCLPITNQTKPKSSIFLRD